MGDFEWKGAQIPGQAAGAQQAIGTYGQKVITIPLAYVRAGSGTLTTAEAVIKIVNPSRRLACAFQVYFEPSARQAINTYDVASVWTVRVWDPDGDHELHELEEGEDLPAQYEMESLAPGAQIVATLGIPKTAAAATISGRWMCKVRWEASMPFCAEEMAYLYQGATASLVRVTSGELGP